MPTPRPPAVALLALSALAGAHAAPDAPDNRPKEYPGYKLVWHDEFDQDGAPDATKWTFETGFTRNKELQWYRAENAAVKSGLLVIEGRRERVKNPGYVAGSPDWRKQREYAEYTSACVKSKGRASWTYGRFEIRARFKAEKGLWPAIWTLGDKGPWPLNGEIDLLEYYQNTILANTVYGEQVWNTVKTPYPHFAAKDAAWDSRFHVWRMDWDAHAIRIYLDDELLHTTDVTKTVNPDGKNPFRAPHHILLNLAIGATGGDPSKATFPSRYEIDYVRVYQKASEGKSADKTR